jgi:hypothetical protein
VRGVMVKRLVISFVILSAVGAAMAGADCMSDNESHQRVNILVDAYRKTSLDNGGKYSSNESEAVTGMAIEAVVELSANKIICNNRSDKCNFNRLGEYFTSLNRFYKNKEKMAGSEKYVYLRTYNLLSDEMANCSFIEK